MKSNASSISFGLFVIVVLAALYSLLAGRGQKNWGLVIVLAGILLLRLAMFVINLRQQRRNIMRGKGPVRIETRLGLNDEPPASADASGASSSGADEKAGQ